MMINDDFDDFDDFKKIEQIITDEKIELMDFSFPSNKKNFIYQLILVNKNHCILMTDIKKRLNINDPILYKYVTKIHEESINYIADIGNISIEDLTECLKYDKINKTKNYEYCIIYCEDKEIIISALYKNDSENEYIEMLMYCIRLYRYIFDYIETFTDKDIRKFLILWNSIQYLYTRLHYKLDVFISSVDIDSEGKHTEKTHFSNKIKLENKYSSFYSQHRKKRMTNSVKHINEKTMKRLNSYLVTLLKSFDISEKMINIFSFEHEKNNKIIYNEINNTTINYIDPALIKECQDDSDDD